MKCIYESNIQKKQTMSLDELVTLFVRFQNLGEMMTLGRNDAAISPSFIEGLTLEGPIGHAGKVIHAPFHTCGWPCLVLYLVLVVV